MLSASASRRHVEELLVETNRVEVLFEELGPRECRLLWKVDMKTLKIALVLHLMRTLREKIHTWMAAAPFSTFLSMYTLLVTWWLRRIATIS
jgi:hypothetical protein